MGVQAAGRSSRVLHGAGELLGWSWMFSPYRWQFMARAMKETDAIFFHGTVLREYCERDPRFGFELMKRMSAVMNRRMQALFGQSPTQFRAHLSEGRRPRRAA